MMEIYRKLITFVEMIIAMAQVCGSDAVLAG